MDSHSERADWPEPPAARDGADLDGVPVEEEPVETPPPRRAASARFEIETEVGSHAALREAMDPANQSLAEALRLSFRVLQVVIVILLALFLVSGCRIVKSSQSGVMTFFGKIQGSPGSQALEPGRHWSRWPFPAGDFKVFEVENRSVDLGNVFWPAFRRDRTLESVIDTATVGDPLSPGRDGSVVTRDGDLAHLKLAAKYVVDDPVEFVGRVENQSSAAGRLEADRLVELALQRAVVHVTSMLSLQELVDLSRESKDRIQASAQGLLDDIGCGLRLVEVNVPGTTPPLAIVRAYGALQEAKVNARALIERAHQDATETLINTAGSNYLPLGRLIDRFAVVSERGEDRAAADLLAEINDALASKETGGGVARMLNRARAHGAEIESTLGREARRFEALLPDYLENPQVTVRKRWLEARANVLGNEYLRIITVADGRRVTLNIPGSQNLSRRLRKRDLDRREQAAQREALGGRRPYINRARDINIDKAGRQLRITEDGELIGIPDRR